MDKDAFIVGLCAFGLMVTLSLSYTGFVIMSQTCCTGDYCDPLDACSALQPDIEVPSSVLPHTETYSFVAVMLFLLGISIIHSKLKIQQQN